MKKLLSRFTQTYWGSHLDLRVRLFNILAIGGTLASFVIGWLNLFAGRSLGTFIVDMMGAAGAFALIVFGVRTGRYRVCYFLTIIVIFLGMFPYLFLHTGGYHGGFMTFFIFAVVFTVVMLDGKSALFVTVLELAVYAGLCVYNYINPGAIPILPNEKSYFITNILDLLVVGAALGATMYAQMRLYRKQQQKLDEQNTILAEASRAKTEFLANSSHEMRTPLTIISVNVQTVKNILEDLAVKDPDANKLLKNAQSEIMRLSRMVGGMLTLASMSENTDRQAADFSAILQSGADALHLSIHNHGNTLETDIAPDLKIFGDADLLTQVISNLLQNAGAHTENGVVSLAASRNADEITVTVRDTGTGIPPELLPRVFERGVTTDGTGFGLYLCKTVVESHGGRIWIENEQEGGAAVTFTLPYYQGQFGGDAQ